MRRIAILIVVICLASIQALAQDKAPEFEQMSLEQLQSVNKASLTKSERRAHKRALRAAKKQKISENVS